LKKRDSIPPRDSNERPPLEPRQGAILAENKLRERKEGGSILAVPTRRVAAD